MKPATRAEGDPGPAPLGRRLAIWGVTGSGKSTLGARLGALLGLDVIELDSIRHARGWESVDWPEFRERLAARLDGAEHGWIVEGGYPRVAELYTSRLDSLLWLRLPLWSTFPAVVRRTLQRVKDPAPLYGPEGPRETLRQALLQRESILIYSLAEHRSVNRQRARQVAELPAHVRVRVLQSRAAIRRLVAEVEARAARGADA